MLEGGKSLILEYSLDKSPLVGQIMLTTHTHTRTHMHTHTHLSGLSVVFPGCRCRNSRMIRSIQTSSTDCLTDTLFSFFSFFLSSLPLAFYISHSHSGWAVCLSVSPVNLSQTDLKSLPHSLRHTVKLSELNELARGFPVEWRSQHLFHL